MSNEQNPLTLNYTGCLIGILIVVYFDPYTTGLCSPQYTRNNQGSFHFSGGGFNFKRYFYSYLGEMIQFDWYFFRWVEITNVTRISSGMLSFKKAWVFVSNYKLYGVDSRLVVVDQSVLSDPETKERKDREESWYCWWLKSCTSW